MKIKVITTCSSLVLFAALSSGCVESVDNSQAVSKAEPQPVKVEKTAASTPKQNSGKVKSVQMAAGYSYIEVDVLGDVFWLATAVSAVKPGDEIAWNSYAMMSDFKSKSLNRSFDQIMFVDRIVKATANTNQVHLGRVVETMNSAGYSYILVDEAGAMVWLAVPESVVSVGQEIRWNSAAPMRNFNSPSLNRSFDEIFFVNSIMTS